MRATQVGTVLALERGHTHTHTHTHNTHRGDVQRPDDKGRRPLHIAATYGHLLAVEFLLNHGANLYALDDFGRTATKAAAFHNKTACCRYLDTLSVKWEIQNRDFVMKLQRKALNSLKKRAERNEKESSTKPKLPYSYATAPASAVSPVRARVRPSSGGARRKKMAAHEALRQNFELRSSASVTNLEERPKKDDEMRSESLTEFGSNSSPTLAFRPALNQGPMLNSLAQLPFKLEPPDELSPESGFHSKASSSISDMDLPDPTGRGKHLPQLELVDAHTASNESSLVTFLSSLGLDDCLPQFKEEKLDLKALSLCSESDLVSIGLPLGPRKKLLHAIERRKELFANAGKMTDTEL